MISWVGTVRSSPKPNHPEAWVFAYETEESQAPRYLYHGGKKMEPRLCSGWQPRTCCSHIASNVYRTAGLPSLPHIQLFQQLVSPARGISQKTTFYLRNVRGGAGVLKNQENASHNSTGTSPLKESLIGRKVKAWVEEQGPAHSAPHLCRNKAWSYWEVQPPGGFSYLFPELRGKRWAFNVLSVWGPYGLTRIAGTREKRRLFRHLNCDHNSQKPPASWQPGLWKQQEKEASPEGRSEPSGGRPEKEVVAAPVPG